MTVRQLRAITSALLVRYFATPKVSGHAGQVPLSSLTWKAETQAVTRATQRPPGSRQDEGDCPQLDVVAGT